MQLKPSQNKKEQKIFQLHHFLNNFSQLPAVKSIQKTVQLDKFFGPSCFEPALVHTLSKRRRLKWEGGHFAGMPMVADGRGVGVKNRENLLTS